MGGTVKDSHPYHNCGRVARRRRFSVPAESGTNEGPTRVQGHPGPGPKPGQIRPSRVKGRGRSDAPTLHGAREVNLGRG